MRQSLRDRNSVCIQQLSRFRIAFAGLLSLSVRQTQRLLLSYFGKTFSQKLTEARMAAAYQFLENTRLSVTEIAGLLGFSSIEHFSAAFHRNAGCSPRAWRKEKQAAPESQGN